MNQQNHYLAQYTKHAIRGVLMKLLLITGVLAVISILLFH
jgi:hypothetical protein